MAAAAKRFFINCVTQFGKKTPRSFFDHGWITFSIDGAYAYPDTGDVIDPKTKQIIATLTDADGKSVRSSKFIEIHFRGGRPVRVGNQFGIGRVTDKAAK